jgi:hypothetical protein
MRRRVPRLPRYGDAAILRARISTPRSPRCSRRRPSRTNVVPLRPRILGEQLRARPVLARRGHAAPLRLRILGTRSHAVLQPRSVSQLIAAFGSHLYRPGRPPGEHATRPERRAKRPRRRWRSRRPPAREAGTSRRTAVQLEPITHRLGLGVPVLVLAPREPSKVAEDHPGQALVDVADIAPRLRLLRVLKPAPDGPQLPADAVLRVAVAADLGHLEPEGLMRRHPARWPAGRRSTRGARRAPSRSCR